jgi:hypothetical protein
MISDHKKWVQQWSVAADKLEEQRALELSALTDTRAGEISEWLLSLAENKRLSGTKKLYSGLVKQQKYFMQWHE